MRRVNSLDDSGWSFCQLGLPRVNSRSSIASEERDKGEESNPPELLCPSTCLRKNITTLVSEWHKPFRIFIIPCNFKTTSHMLDPFLRRPKLTRVSLLLLFPLRWEYVKPISGSSCLLLFVFVSIDDCHGVLKSGRRN